MGSSMQEPFLREMALNFKMSLKGIATSLDVEDDPEAMQKLEHQLQSLFHGILVTLDGGSALADEGLIYIVDESGQKFDRWLHEVYLEYFPSEHH